MKKRKPRQFAEVATLEQLEPRLLLSDMGLAAFPGAEGFGAASLGGRGDGSQIPQIIVVDTLEDVVADDGMTSLREAVEATGPRFVVFSVDGVIALESVLAIENPYITISGQTAASGSITLANYGISIQGGAHDVVIRYLRIRPLVVRENTNSVDGIQLYGSSESNFVDNVIIDHCSMAWALDENFSVWGWVGNFTVQYSFILEGSQYGHEKGPHSMGILTGGEGSQGMTNGTFHHNLIAHNTDRSPKLSGGNMYDFRNNVIYNWSEHNAGNITDAMQVNFVNNFYIDGPDVTDEVAHMNMVKLPSPEGDIDSRPSVYFSGNVGPLGVVENDWDAGIKHYGQPELYRLDEPVAMPAVETDSVLDALNDVLDNAGANYLSRDLVDESIVSEIRYVLKTYSEDSLNVQVPEGVNDPNLGTLGPAHGVLTEVLELSVDRNHPDYANYIPRSHRLQEGQTTEEAKVALLDFMVAKGRITEEHKQEILADSSGTYEWEIVDRIIPDLDTVLATMPTTSVSLNQDSDSDGLPDDWEEAHGLDKNNPSDAILDRDSDGYLNIEEYINALEEATVASEDNSVSVSSTSSKSTALSSAELFALYSDSLSASTGLDFDYTSSSQSGQIAESIVADMDFLAVDSGEAYDGMDFDDLPFTTLYTATPDEGYPAVSDSLASVEAQLERA